MSHLTELADKDLENLLYMASLVYLLSSKGDDKLGEHDIVKKIRNSKKIRNGKDDITGLIRVTGYVADSPVEDSVRLFADLNFDVYIDIPKNKIIHVEEIPKDKMEFGGTCIWISKDTEITYTKIERSKIEAQFLEGKIMEDYLPSAEYTGFMPDIMAGRPPTLVSCGDCATRICSRTCSRACPQSRNTSMCPTPNCSRWCPSLFVCP